MSTLLAIDPGIHTGWAVFMKDVGLSFCGLGIPPPLEDDSQVVIECPRVYRSGKADPNDLIVLARKVGRFEERYVNCSVKLVYPADWKGQTPKRIQNDRTYKALDTAEQAIYLRARCAPSLRNNILDAIGLGLWYIGR